MRTENIAFDVLLRSAGVTQSQKHNSLPQLFCDILLGFVAVAEETALKFKFGDFFYYFKLEFKLHNILTPSLKCLTALD